MEVMTHAVTGVGSVDGEYAARGTGAQNFSRYASPMRACRKEGAQPMAHILVHLHENVLARLGERRSSSSHSLLSGAETPRGGANRGAPRMPDACMVKPSQVERAPAAVAVKDEPEEEEPLLDLLATLDPIQLLRLSCARAVRQGEILEQVGFEKTRSKAHVFEDHLYLAKPKRRTRMTRNNACLDLGALYKRARPCSMEETLARGEL
ncbi:hypothetical protein T484DRAFT_1952562 [Baffinella frigidus]|nr:hypothetical protein T484DRAFT_1952562 [Cryptophyta sp. CCMP2293]